MSEESEALKESAKAAQEIAKTTSNAIDAGRDAGGWLDRIFGGAIEDTVGLVWSDRVKARRIAASIYDWERMLLLFRKTEAKLRKKGVDTTRIPPPKIMLPLLEHVTLENEDGLHTLWANLLASAMDPTAEEIERIYVSVLAELSGNDAEMLQAMYAEWWYWENRKSEFDKKVSERYASGVGGVSEFGERSVILFYRLGLVLPVSVEVVEKYHPAGHDDHGDWDASAEKTVVAGDLSVVSFTEFGEKFCEAVIGDVQGLYRPPEWKRWSSHKLAR